MRKQAFTSLAGSCAIEARESIMLELCLVQGSRFISQVWRKGSVERATCPFNIAQSHRSNVEHCRTLQETPCFYTTTAQPMACLSVSRASKQNPGHEACSNGLQPHRPSLTPWSSLVYIYNIYGRRARTQVFGLVFRVSRLTWLELATVCAEETRKGGGEMRKGQQPNTLLKNQ